MLPEHLLNEIAPMRGRRAPRSATRQSAPNQSLPERMESIVYGHYQTFSYVMYASFGWLREGHIYFLQQRISTIAFGSNTAEGSYYML